MFFVVLLSPDSSCGPLGLLPESGEEQSVVFVVPADEFEALRVAEAGEEWRLWVVEGQCSRVQARGDAGRGSGAGTWSLAVVAA